MSLFEQQVPLVWVEHSHNAGSEVGNAETKRKEGISAKRSAFSSWDMLRLASGECTQNKEYGMSDYYKREPLDNKNSYKKTTYWAVEMKNVFIYCEKHITRQNTWRRWRGGEWGEMGTRRE